MKEIYLKDNLGREDFIRIIEELNEKNSNQDTFILNITHDLRGHLNVIISALQFIQYNNNTMDEKDIKYFNIIKRNSYKMLRLINNLIDTRKLESNKFELDKKNINIVSMIECTVECIEKYALEKNINLIFDTNSEECIISVDPEVIDRILMNLISNAIKFSSKGSNIYISLNITETEVEISVKDQGAGISKEEQKNIFDRFYQSKYRNNKDIIGSGIGLDLANYLAKTHGGRIELISEIGEGSEFIVKIPIMLDDNNKNLTENFGSKVQMLEIEFSDIYLI